MDKRNLNHDLTKTSYGNVENIKYDLAILPWGATEPHNKHLPYTTDCILSQSIAIDASYYASEKENVNCMVLPPIPLGQQNPGQWGLPFCIHTRYETQKAILNDIIVSLERQGIKKLLIINGHGGNSFKPMIRDMVFEHPLFLVATADWFSIVPQSEYFENKDDHAGELETSVMMHYHPELVDLSIAGNGRSKGFAVESLRKGTGWIPRNWSKVSIDTGIGDPSMSSAEKGRRYATEVANRIALLCIDLVKYELYYR